MKMELYNYAIFPIVFPAEKEVTITIRPLGDHVSFKAPEYTLQLMDIDDLASKKNESFTVKPDEDGCIRVTAAFHGEKEHYIRIFDGDRRIVQLSVYSLAPDMSCRLPFRGDLHMHTCRSDGREAPAIVAANYRAKGYDFLSITDHHRYDGSLEAMAQFAPIPTIYNLVPGEEVHLPLTDVHIVNFGGVHTVNNLMEESHGYKVTGGDPKKLSLDGKLPFVLTRAEYDETIRKLADTLDVPEDVDKLAYAVCVWAFDQIRAADGLAIFAHPYWLANVFHVSDPLTRCLMENHPFDAFEVLGGENYYQQNGYQTVLYYEEWKKGRVHPIVGSTDSHGSTEHNRNGAICSTIVFSPANERAALIASIKDRYSVAVDTISHEYRLVGEERFQRYACFLMDNWYPIHDRFCADEGHWMKEYLTGNTDGAMDVLQVLGGKMQALFDKYFIVE
ncbi:MAG: hypothetical protein IKV57_09105 [Clostridia bacterium]|nr:hypothetical protein [Clostridia bacterium]